MLDLGGVRQQIGGDHPLFGVEVPSMPTRPQAGTPPPGFACATLFAALAVLGCGAPGSSTTTGGQGGDGPASGGSGDSGGSSGQGGSTGSASGGSTGSGGAPGTGGASATGSGGATATGGTGAGSGGATSTGGNGSGGSPTGSGGASGGSTGTGGAKGGTSGSGGSPGSGGSGRGGAAGGGATGSGGASSGGATGQGGSAGAPATGALIHNDVFWKDTSGTPIYSQGGGVFNFNGTYYWYGVKYNGAVSYAANTKKNSDTSFAAITCYSSTDLVTWKHENDVLSTASLGANVDSATWIGRMGVVYNANTKKYVLISQYQGGPAGTGELFATSDTPTGTFAFDHIQAAVTNVANTTTGDQTIFTDDDGKSYLICSSSSGRSNLYVAPIHASDSLSIDAATRIFGGAGREGNTMFKYNGMYYFCSSDLHGWNASHSYYIAASNIMGPYGAEGVIGNTDNDFSHVTQTGLFVTVKGTSGTTVIFAGDRWSDFAGNGLGFNDWCPLTFNGATPTMASMSEWSFNAVAGTWSVGPDNNYVLNPSFEADRVAMTQPAGWTTSTTTSGATPYSNVSGGHTGNWAWQLTSTGAYQATLKQAITGLPNGTYTLSVWAKSTGGQTTANLYASGYGGAEKDASLTKAMSGWTQVSIAGVAISNGTCQVGVTTTAGANQSVTLDDFTLVRTGP
jgi:hypothetical protein